MNTPTPQLPAEPKRAGMSTLKLLLIILCCMFVTAMVAIGGCIWWFNHYFNPKPHQPVQLTQPEQQQLDAKLTAFSAKLPPPAAPTDTPAPVMAEGMPAPLDPEMSKRTLLLTEREMNSYLAKQNLGDKVKVQFGQGIISANVILQAPADFPFIAGQKIRLDFNFTASASGTDKRLGLVMDDVSVGGIPLPNAWLGDLKGIDIIEQRLKNDRAFKRFLDGINTLEIKDGQMRVILNK
jgi:hypothetical protein